jgi:hypothetical protein
MIRTARAGLVTLFYVTRNVLIFCSLTLLLLGGCGVSQTSSGPTVAPAAQQSNGGSANPPTGFPGSSPPQGQPPLPPTAAVNPAGVWDLKDTLNGTAVSETALIGNRTYLARATADQYGCQDLTAGTYTIEGELFSGGGASTLLAGCMAPGGQTYVNWTLTGWVTNTELNLDFASGTSIVPTLGATLDPLYSEASSLTRLTGTWNDGGNTLTINADGTFVEMQTSGCTLNGAFTILDTTHNLYGVSFELTGCTSSLAGIPFTGLAYVDDTNPTDLLIHEGASGPNPADNTQVVVVFDDIPQT